MRILETVTKLEPALQAFRLTTGAQPVSTLPVFTHRHGLETVAKLVVNLITSIDQPGKRRKYGDHSRP